MKYSYGFFAESVFFHGKEEHHANYEIRVDDRKWVNDMDTAMEDDWLGIQNWDEWEGP